MQHLVVVLSEQRLVVLMFVFAAMAAIVVCVSVQHLVLVVREQCLVVLMFLFAAMPCASISV